VTRYVIAEVCAKIVYSSCICKNATRYAILQDLQNASHVRHPNGSPLTSATTCKLVSINLHPYLHTNGSFTGSVQRGDVEIKDYVVFPHVEETLEPVFLLDR
jgi:hypothetical protein